MLTFCSKMSLDRETSIEPRTNPPLGTLFGNIFLLPSSGSSSSGTPGLSRSLDFLEAVSSHLGDASSCEE